MKIYLVADARFFDKDAAQELNMTIEEYNQQIVDNINSLTTKENPNHFCFLGVISLGSFEETKALFAKIGGIKSLIDYNYTNQHLTREQWKEIGFTYIWTNSCAQKAVINNKEVFVVIEVEKDNLEKVLNLGHYVAIAGSMIGYDKIYENHLLNISIDKWDYFPIELEKELPRIFDDQELFLRMEDSE